MYLLGSVIRESENCKNNIVINSWLEFALIT